MGFRYESSFIVDGRCPGCFHLRCRVARWLFYDASAANFR